MFFLCWLCSCVLFSCVFVVLVVLRGDSDKVTVGPWSDGRHVATLLLPVHGGTVSSELSGKRSLNGELR